MKHLEEGQLRAYYDGALSAGERERVERHLAACAQCARAADAVRARGTRVQAWLASTDPQPTRAPVSPQGARNRLEGYIDRKKEQEMRKDILARRYRPAWVVAALAVALAVALSFAPVRTLAGNLLSLFRVHKIQFVEVNPAQFPDEDALEAAARKFESVMQDQMRVVRDGETQVVDEATVRSLSVFRVRLPSAVDGDPRITLDPGLHVAMQIDLPRIRTLLAELGYVGVELPDSLDGAEVRVDFGPSVAAAYGSCGPGGDQGAEAQDTVDPNDRPERNCTVLLQMPSPGVSAPSDLDVDQLGRAYLQLLGLSDQEAERFSQRVDWTTTLVVPVPRAQNLQYQDVRVDGVAGTLIRPPRYNRGGQAYLLTWIKNDIVYALNGSGTTEDALRIAGSLQ